jgi:hypothetical protein
MTKIIRAYILSVQFNTVNGLVRSYKAVPPHAIKTLGGEKYSS